MKGRIVLVVISCVLSLTIGWVLRRGGSVESKGPGRKVLIGFSMDTLKEERWQHDRDYLVARTKELGADILVQAANSDDTRQIADVQALDMWLDVNGQRMQTGSTATMIFNVVQIVSYISHFMVLEAGDVITTGTPPGVGLGMKPPVFLKPGDVMSLGIAGLGDQKQSVVGWSRG